MANVEALSRPAKRSYEEWNGQRKGKEIWDLICPDKDVDTSSTFDLDRYTESPYGIAYRDRNNPSHLRPYKGGTGRIIDLPRASEVTPVGEELSDTVIVGLDPTSPQAQHYKKLLDDIVKLHMGGHVMTRRKQIVDMIFDSIFHAKGDGGKDLDLDIEFERDADNTMAHNFTTTDTPSDALREMQDQLIAKGCSLDDSICLVGTTWLGKFYQDTTVQKFLDSNEANHLLSQPMIPPQVQGTWGLRVVSVYRAPTMEAPVWICRYQPGVPYVAYKGAASAAWVTATKCAMLSLSSPRYNIQRGMDVLNEAGKKTRVVGEVVFDGFSSKDPVAEYIRSSTRHAFVPANTDHIVTSTGTFA